MLTQTVEVRPAETHQSRWGYHPCGKEMFLLLKQLHKHYRKAVTGYHVWLRWKRKAEQNRVIRRAIRDEKGNRVGSEIVGPRPEPKLCPVFYGPVMVKTHYHEGKYHAGGIMVEQMQLRDLGIVADYASARFPKADPANVTALVLAAADVRKMLAQLEG